LWIAYRYDACTHVTTEHAFRLQSDGLICVEFALSKNKNKLSQKKYFIIYSLTCAPDLLTMTVRLDKNRTLDPILILTAGGCTLTTAKPSRLQRDVVIIQ